MNKIQKERKIRFEYLFFSFLFLFNSDLMLVQINDIVASMMVLPNRQVVALVNDLKLAPLRWSNPQV